MQPARRGQYVSTLYTRNISSSELTINEPAYGVVYRAMDLTTPPPHTVVALKQMRLSDHERTNGMPITSIREIALLRSLRHPNIISVLDVAAGRDMADVYMVMEYAEQVGTLLTARMKLWVFSCCWQGGVPRFGGGFERIIGWLSGFPVRRREPRNRRGK